MFESYTIWMRASLNSLVTRIRARLGLRMKCKILFMSDEERKNRLHFDFPLFLYVQAVLGSILGV